MTELPVRAHYVGLQTLNEGLLLPWIAPAVRGMVLQPLRDHFCASMGGRKLAVSRQGLANWQQQPSPNAAKTQDVRNRHYCTGCIKNKECNYGRTFEPDLEIIDRSLIERNDTQGVRAISIASAMLIVDGAKPPRSKDSRDYQFLAPRGLELNLRLLAMGDRAMDLLPIVIEAIDALGQQKGLGYQSPVRYRVEREQTTVEDWPLKLNTLPIEVGSGVVAEVTLELLSPLLIKSCFSDGRFVTPTMDELLRNSIRTVIRSIRELVEPSYLREVKLSDFLMPAREIESVANQLERFEQPSISHRGAVDRRGYRERPLRGWLGSITYRDVPASYLPWLHWGGRLGIGTDRNRGAGLWRIIL